jgi:hypothetical protein
MLNAATRWCGAWKVPCRTLVMRYHPAACTRGVDVQMPRGMGSQAVIAWSGNVCQARSMEANASNDLGRRNDMDRQEHSSRGKRKLVIRRNAFDPFPYMSLPVVVCNLIAPSSPSRPSRPKIDYISLIASHQMPPRAFPRTKKKNPYPPPRDRHHEILTRTPTDLIRLPAHVPQHRQPLTRTQRR